MTRFGNRLDRIFAARLDIRAEVAPNRSTMKYFHARKTERAFRDAAMAAMREDLRR
jgi:hypothetical protein